MDLSNKLLLANGCSHMAGLYQGDRDDLYSPAMKQGRSPAAKLAKLTGMEYGINLAAPGGSNDYIVRTTMQWIADNPGRLKDIFVLIGWTEGNRREQWWYYDPNAYDYVPRWEWKLPWWAGADRTHEYHHERGGGPQRMQANDAERMVNNGKHDGDYLSFSRLYYQNCDPWWNQLARARQIIQMQHLLSGLGIPYLFYNADDDILPDDQIALQLLDTTRFYQPYTFAGVELRKKFEWGYCYHFDHDANEYLAGCMYEFMVNSPAYAG